MFKIGDKVKIKKPKRIEEGWEFSWVSSMDEYDGTIQTISDIKKNYYEVTAYLVPYGSYLFREDWMEKVVVSAAELNKEALMKRFKLSTDNIPF